MRDMIFSSVIAGVLAALALTLIQALWITPLILEAETFEQSAVPVPAGAEAHQHSGGSHNGEHHHDAHDHHHGDAWAPEDGWQRTLATAVSNSLLGVGFALMLTGIYALRRPQGVIHGMAWGLAGFIAFFASPSIGLPPELPGTEAASLTERQVWWLATAASTAAGLALLCLQKHWAVRLLALPLLIAPHLVGAPHPAVVYSVAPGELQQSFRIATLAVNAAFWVLLGALSALVYQRFTREVTP